MKEIHQDAIYCSKKWKPFLWLILSIIFVIMGIDNLRHGNQAVFNYFCIILFGLCGAISLILLLPGSSYLKIKDEGFEWCILFRKRRHSWKDISAFGVFKTYRGWIPTRLLAYSFVPEYDQRRIGRIMGANLGGFEAALPDTYGFKATNLAALMNRYLNEYRERCSAEPANKR